MLSEVWRNADALSEVYRVGTPMGCFWVCFGNLGPKSFRVLSVFGFVPFFMSVVDLFALYLKPRFVLSPPP